MYKVVKRDGRIVDFDISKISNAIHKAFANTDTPEIDGVVDLLALRTTAEFAPKIKDDLIAIEDIQDSVESVLSKTGYEDVAKAYILYRKQRERIRNTNNTLLDYKNVVDKYLKVEDWRVKENSTVTYSIGGLILSNSGAITANYWLSEIYDKEIADAHRRCDFHIHDLSMMSAYCAGWSLKQLIQEGLGGIPGKITSAPASHLSTLCNQMVNFLGIMQNEWAGAQAFSSFDTYLAPFVKKDNLTYKQVKQALQSFVFGVNTPSRWGCVDTDTEVLSVNGFKKYDELQEGDLIYTWHDGKLEVNTVNKVIVKPHKGKMHVYKGRGYNQTVTPNHRVLVKKYNKPEYEIKRSEEIFDEKSPLPLPTMFNGSQISGAPLTDKEIELAAIIYTDGSLDFRNGSIHKIKIFKSPNRNGCERIEALLDAVRCEYTKKYRELTEDMYSSVYEYVIYGDSARRLVDLVGQKDKIDSKFMQMNFEQANLFLKTWSQFDGDERKFMCQYDNDVIRDQLQQIAVLAGKCSHLRFKKLPSGRTTNYVKIRQSEHIFIRQKEELDYDGLVWCPNVDNGTAVFRKDNCVFISGQTQAPFSNITLDWTVPPDLKDLPAIVGGKEQDFTYGDCKTEMDMINKAFIEIMIEGDANGRGFQYPIPTYSITREFDWSPTENNKLLFEMTAKYGTPYFSNYINSDMEPSDVRSMCPMVPNTKVVIKNGRGEITVDTIENVFKKYGKNGKTVNVWTGIGWADGRPVQTPKTEVYDIRFTNGASVKFGKDHLQPLVHGVTFHADQLKPGMLVPFVSNSIRNNRIEEGNTGYVGVAIESIEKCNFSGECLYCFEIDNDDHLFALANGLVTHNCRLRLDLRELRRKSGGYFGSGESTGSVGVCSLNMPRIAYQSGDEVEFFDRLDKLMDLAARSLKIKRDVITKLLDNGLYPYTKRYLGNLDSHFSTIGLVGMNEAGLNAKWIRKDMTHPECQEFTKRVLNHMRERLSDYQEQYGDLYNLEATPAESTAYRFAKHDREDFPDIITAAEAGGEPYYTNSSHLPVGYTDDIFSALDIQDDLQTLYTSGTVFHAFLGEKLPTWEATANLVRKIAENYRLPYYTISPTYSVCKEHGYLNGEQFVCPHCGQPTEVYSRITGYYRPVQHWNDGKVQEYKQRREYIIGTSRLTHVGPKPEHGDARPVAEQVAEGTAINANGEAVAVKPGAKLLFSTETCPNCKLACGKMDAAGVVYDKLLVSQNEALTKQFDIMQVPTMVVVTENGCDKFCGAGAILQQIKNWV